MVVYKAYIKKTPSAKRNGTPRSMSKRFKIELIYPNTHKRPKIPRS